MEETRTVLCFHSAHSSRLPSELEALNTPLRQVI